LKTIFFGPWIGEFGWEYSHWHAWVNQVSREKYKNNTTIASSFEGREPFYRHTSKFLAHPEKYNKLFKGRRNYITDNWIGNRPSFNDISRDKKFDSKSDYYNQIKHAEELLNFYKKNLPDDTIFYVPWLLNKINLNGKSTEVGVKNLGLIPNKKKFIYQSTRHILINKISNYFLNRNIKYNVNAHLYHQGIATYPIDLVQQNFFKLKSVKNPDRNILNQVERKYENHIISIFPRKRDDRRPDKNFGEKNYIDLIELLKKRLPNSKVALLGDPNGSYFTDGVPEGCIDLINISHCNRMNNQLYILENSMVALGSISGAMLVSLGAGCSSLIWGYPDARIPTQDNNPLSTPMYYINDMHPKISDILKGLEKLGIL
jgi:hypothetical protein